MAEIEGQVRTRHIEPRWPVAAAIVAVLAVISGLPARVRLFPSGVTVLVAVTMLVPVVGVGLTVGRAWWLRAERLVTFLFCSAVGVSSAWGLARLIQAIVNGPAGISGTQLLASSVAVWVSNVLVFSLLYWQMDRGGPEARVNHAARMPDWLFPQEGAPREDTPPDWRPTFVDYLFLAYSTATAFSATDAPPLTARAKLLMMVEGTVSLVTMAVTASRAINVLGN